METPTKRRGRFDVMREEEDAGETVESSGDLPPGQGEKEPDNFSGSTQGGEPAEASGEGSGSSLDVPSFLIGSPASPGHYGGIFLLRRFPKVLCFSTEMVWERLWFNFI